VICRFVLFLWLSKCPDLLYMHSTSFVLYSKYTDLNRKFLQRKKTNAKTFLFLMPHVLKVFCSCAFILITFSIPTVYFKFT